MAEKRGWYNSVLSKLGSDLFKYFDLHAVPQVLRPADHKQCRNFADLMLELHELNDCLNKMIVDLIFICVGTEKQNFRFCESKIPKWNSQTTFPTMSDNFVRFLGWRYNRHNFFENAASLTVKVKEFRFTGRFCLLRWF